MFVRYALSVRMIILCEAALIVPQVMVQEIGLCDKKNKVRLLTLNMCAQKAWKIKRPPSLYLL